ncbi:hypothetical protein BXO87_02335 [Bacillus sp. GZB]|uniref:hypothetical protein n=1 Tax=Bacillus TaxID=1386 RepID=UPI0009785203|nr:MULTISPECIES: hypothetical protein [Bacillus]MCZ4246960.1 hypothetical protein [Bacillus amyloliquefaciens]OMQ06864.1 hypothetical protein BXO87_02335 [Bacillus sp. GZB]
MSLYKSALRRLGSQQSKILDLLKERESRGAYNFELAKIAMSYQRRVHELVEQGYQISVCRVSKGTYKYTLIGKQTSLPQNQTILDKVIREIEENYGGSVDALELLDIAEKVGANISYKGVTKATRSVKREIK